MNVIENLHPGHGGDSILELPGLPRLGPGLGLLPLDSLTEGGPLYLVLGHPGESLGDEGGEETTEQSRGEGRDDDRCPEDRLYAGLPVQGVEGLCLGFVQTVVVLRVVRVDPRRGGGGRDLDIVVDVAGGLVRPTGGQEEKGGGDG